MKDSPTHLRLTYRLDPRTESQNRNAVDEIISAVNAARRRLGGLTFDTRDDKVRHSLLLLEDVSMRLAKLRERL